jgi:hypothetical protein
MKRLVALALASALATSLLVLAMISTPAHAQDAAPRLPDLRMAEFHDLKIRYAPDGTRLLRFSAIIVNVGAGAFEVHGGRPNTDTSTMAVTQRIYDNAGGYREVPTSAVMFFSGDGHDHWHVKGLQRYTLRKLSGSEQVRKGAKEGFCFYDTYIWNGALPGAPERKHYRDDHSCAKHDPEALRATMGLSVGWSDVYQYYLPFQWIDITGLPSGRYRLTAVADAQRRFKESREDNNYTWVDIELEGNKVKALDYGPAARYCGPTGRWCYRPYTDT